MDKRIREVLRANEKLDIWQVKGQSLSPSWTKQWDGRKGKSRKERGRKRESFRESDSIFSLNFRSDQRFLAEQEEEFNLTARASHRDRSWGVFIKTPSGRVFLLLGLILV